jgi:GntR family transcriptional regulator, arabinose operon transcriptional repressor
MARQVDVGEGRHKLPAYQRIIDHISGAIVAQHLSPGTALPSERQLSADFGVTRATVARAMRELEHAGLIERRQGRGTFVAAPATTIQPSSTLVCIFPDLQAPFITGIIRGIEKAARLAGHHLVIANSARSHALEAEHVERAQRMAQGALLWPLDGTANLPLIERLSRSGFPLVLVDRTLPGLSCDSVVADNYSAGFLLTSYLLDQGHERIAFVQGEELMVSSVAERFLGYQHAFEAKGKRCHPRWVSSAPYGPGVLEEQRHDCVARLLAYHPRPTAFIAIHAGILIALIHDLVHFGVRIPDDVVLATTDNTEGDGLLRLATASILFDCVGMGEQAVRLLLNRRRLGKAITVRQVVIPVELHADAAISVSIAPRFSFEEKSQA